MDDDRTIPRLIVATALAGAGEPDIPWTSLRDAGVEGLLVATVNAAPAVIVGPLRRMVADAGGVPVLISGSPSVAGEVGAGLVLPEAGMAAAEARRHLRAGALMGRQASSVEAAAVAVGVDFLVGKWDELGGGGARVGTAIEAAPAPILWRVGNLDEARAAIASGAEGVILDIAGDPAATVAALGRAPALFASRTGAVRTVCVDGAETLLLPDTAVSDLLADLGLAPGAVRRNGVPVPRRAWDDTLLSPGDVLETTGQDAGP